MGPCVRRLFVSLASSSWFALRPNPSHAQSSSAYDTYASTYDRLDGGQLAYRLGMDDLRRGAISLAQGDVLEVGVGTGLNLPLYDWSRVRTFTALDASSGMLNLARTRAADLGVLSKSRIMIGDVARLPFHDSTFDSIVDTFSLCVFDEPETAVCEMRRVLRPTGRVFLVEHQRATGLAPLAAYQDLTAPLIAPLSKGCVWNQDVRAIAHRAGFRVERAEESLLGTVVSLVLQPVNKSILL